MDLNKLTLFGLVKGHMGWLTRRQEVLAQNVANADTPKYKPQDLKALNFKDMMRKQQQTQLNAVTTSPMHMAGARRATSPFAGEENRTPYETAPDGNAVVLEEQMAKIGETQMQYQLTNELYRKHIGMIKIAIGKGR
ncbi:flagellar basal body rod protein FlgB [Magnetovibrio sp.]|uniref:flagellar basal body rod protein FlgB n=1 Tax=Magnetovibrio sp. TaxID=2024836 RepID=UPI002F92EE55